ncbi:MAG: hypothetical protein AB4290_10470 [Spirulina sp.]
MKNLQNASNIIEHKNCSLELRESAIQLKQLLQPCLDELKIAREKWQRKPKILGIDKQKIWLKLGECSACHVQLMNKKKEIQQIKKEEVEKKWQKRLETLKKLLQEEYIKILPNKYEDKEDKAKLTQDYAKCATEVIKHGVIFCIEEFLQKRLKESEDSLKIISNNIDFIYKESDLIFAKSLIVELKEINSGQDFSKYIAAEFEIKEDEFNLFELVSDVTDSVLGSVGGLVEKFGFGADFISQQLSIQQKIFNRVWETFIQPQDRLIEKIIIIIESTSNQRIESIIQLTQKTILLYENFIETYERYQQETPQQRKQEKVWIEKQIKNIEEMQNSIKIITSSS